MGWYAFDLKGNLYTPYDIHKITFETKKEAIDYLTLKFMDKHRKPEIRRESMGFYHYIIHSFIGKMSHEIVVIDEEKAYDYGFGELIDDFILEFKDKRNEG